MSLIARRWVALAFRIQSAVVQKSAAVHAAGKAQNIQTHAKCKVGCCCRSAAVRHEGSPIALKPLTVYGAQTRADKLYELWVWMQCCRVLCLHLHCRWCTIFA
ncbi:hypothetical protein ABBQ38_012234 [Trebouxia sp. C0009 RCD-2024]